MKKFDSKWYLISIVDPSSLPGKSIFNIIQLMLNEVKFNFVIMDDILAPYF